MKYLLLLIGCLAMLYGSGMSQEVVISDLPPGAAGSIDKELLEPHFAELGAIADTLKKYPLARAVITGSADGLEYRKNNDAVNPGLALGRAHLLRSLMIKEFEVDSTQLIVQSTDVKECGGSYRFVGIRVVRDLTDLESRLNALENRPPVEKHFTEVHEVTHDLRGIMRLQLGIGFSTSPFGGIPIISGAVSYKRIVFVECVGGHTFWNNTYRFNNTDLDTKRRMIGGQIIVFPSEKVPVGIVGGWMRIEEIAQDYYEYVKLSDGPVLGVRVTPFDFLSITGVYNPSKHREANDIKSAAKNDQFLISAMAHIGFGGDK